MRRWRTLAHMARRQAQPIRLEPALEPASGLRGYKTIASSTLVIAQPTSRAVLRTGRVTSDLCDSQHVGPAAPGDSARGRLEGQTSQHALGVALEGTLNMMARMLRRSVVFAR